ncbi:hypothetical protein [Streptomyces sp. Ac-502]|uniref:hypothetical protein n=1 Tax=Streptomyces sp. Ac-502 TaxID=3342801 RepID=UPI003862A1BE
MTENIAPMGRAADRSEETLECGAAFSVELDIKTPWHVAAEAYPRLHAPHVWHPLWSL